MTRTTLRCAAILSVAVGSVVAVALPAASSTGAVIGLWRSQGLPVPRAIARAQLHDISCTSTRQCLAVGYFVSPSNRWYALVERRIGSTWRVVPTPNRPASIASVLAGVSCPAATRCVTVGHWTTTADVTLPLVEAWNGSTWTIRAAPLPSGARSGALGGVSCVTSSWCVAAGWYDARDRSQHTLIEAWNGRGWYVRSSPNLKGAAASLLASVSCATTRSCMAVGYATRPTGTGSLAEAWNGAVWSVTPTPTPPGRPSWFELDGVSCPRASRCVASGDRELSNAAPFVAMAQSWNGARWAFSQPVLPRGTSRSPLTGISCWTGAACVAVGFQTLGGRTITLAERWNGSTWRVEATPNPVGIAYSDLYDVACIVPTACTAAGSAGNGGHLRPLVATTNP